jgi:hypothetical protein
VLQSPDGETLFITQAAGVTLESARQAALTAGDTNQVPIEQKPEEILAEKLDEALEEKPEEMLEEKNEQT